MRHARAAKPVVEERRSHRYTVDIRGILERSAEENAAVRVVDLSRRGFGAECAAPINVDSTVILSLPGVCHAKARIVWSEAGRLGAEFLAPQRLFLIPEVIDQAGQLSPPPG